LRKVICPICNPETGTISFLRCSDRFDKPKNKKYSLTICLGCGLVYLNPRPDEQDIADSYQSEDYDPFISTLAQRSIKDRLYAVLRDRVLDWKKKLINTLITPGSHVLDIGCGTGEFLGALNGNYTVVGIEPEPKAAHWAAKRFGFKVHIGDFNKAYSQLEQYDLITMWHSLEHIPEPLKTLNNINNCLNDNGWLLIALPNFRSLDARLYRSCWVAYDAPRHLWHFSKSQLVQICNKAGFQFDRAGMLPLDTFYNVLQSEICCVKMGGIKQLLITPFRIFDTIIFSLLWGSISGHHSGMYYLFRKTADNKKQ
jgi:2-polyprenyl-3-methyl-5-hydroxy-6-metoxy-1,4-benzoquinol methylase